jgi:hypothetical protein
MKKRTRGWMVAAVLATAAVLSPGSSGAWTLDTPLSQVSASYRGENPEDGLGWSVSEAGDVNADGFDDFLMGSYFNCEGGERAGQAYLVLGRASGWAMDMGAGDSDASFVGTSSWDYVGVDLASAGDVNGDGYDDFLIGAPFDDEGGGSPSDCCDGAGQAYLVLGRDSGWAMDTAVSSADASFLGEAAHDYAGHYLSGGGDVNGDGFDDFLIGAPTNDEGADAGGQVYMILGRPTGWVQDIPLSQADASFLGMGELDQAAISAIEGDVNCDGLSDVLIQSHSDDHGFGVGRLSIFFGSLSGWAADIPLASANASIVGDIQYTGMGTQSGVFSVASGGDLDGDGCDEILVGAPGDDIAGNDSGAAYVIFGHSSGWGTDELLTGEVDVFHGEGTGDQLGIWLDMAGDVNADGLTDLVLGSRYNDEAHTNAGQAYLLHSVADVDVGDATAVVESSFLGEDADDWAGYFLSSAGDVNGDGADDVLISAYRNSDASYSAGQVYLVLGEGCLDGDLDGYSDCEGDCDDGDAAIHPGAVEDCADGDDNDCDGLVDELDDDCAGDDDDTSEAPLDDDDDTWNDPGDLEDEVPGDDCACATASRAPLAPAAALGLLGWFFGGRRSRRRQISD